jgi:hypothetical protein
MERNKKLKNFLVGLLVGNGDELYLLPQLNPNHPSSDGASPRIRGDSEGFGCQF